MRRLLILLPLTVAGCGLLGRHAPTPHYAVYFPPDTANLDEAANRTIAAAADMARRSPGVPVTVGGFADPDGTRQSNKDLSAQRAKVVADRLVADGVAPARVHLAAAGAIDFSMDSIESRRVEITFDRR